MTVPANSIYHCIHYSAGPGLVNDVDWDAADADTGAILKEGHLHWWGTSTGGTIRGLFSQHYYVHLWNGGSQAHGEISNNCS